MSDPRLDPIYADTLYDVLVKEAGASGHIADRAAFVTRQARGCREYRFCGLLGFGGKFRHAPYSPRPLYVDCYSEDLTPERQAVIDRTNAALIRVARAPGSPGTDREGGGHE